MFGGVAGGVGELLELFEELLAAGLGEDGEDLLLEIDGDLAGLGVDAFALGL